MVSCALWRAKRLKDAHICPGSSQPWRQIRRSTRLHARPDEKLRTPHSGYHWDGTSRRFFEGWYFKASPTVREANDSFALIYSVENPAGKSPKSGIGAQIMGPQDGYMMQYDYDVSKFWASSSSLSLGTCFDLKPGRPRPRRILSKESFDATAATGFQASSEFHQGRLIHNERGATGHIEPSVNECSWSFTVEAKTGWGSSDDEQKATAGWLAALPVFEPHWQVMLSQGAATGWFAWGDRRYEFTDAPTYYEKNWGAGFPSRWFWTQCNTFKEVPDLSVTIVGSRRKLPGIEPREETVGMIGIHHLGVFYEFVPWEGEVSWKVDPWGYWSIYGSIEGYEAEVTARCLRPGTLLRAPLDEEGLAPFCRDSFFAFTVLKLWKTSSREKELLVTATSETGVVEVGGGPWWDQWTDRAEMQEPFRTLCRLPIDTAEVSKYVPSFLRPPGL